MTANYCHDILTTCQKTLKKQGTGTNKNKYKQYAEQKKN